MKRAVMCGVLAICFGGCISSLGYVPPAAKSTDETMVPTYFEAKSWAYDVHLALVSRAAANRSALYVGGTLAAAGTAVTAALVGLGSTSPAMMAIPLGAGFLGALGAVYDNNTRADLYGRAAHLVMLAILSSDARVTSGTPPNGKEATCLRRDVFEAMYRVERHLTFLDPKNVSALLSNVKAGAVELTSTEVKAATGDLSDLDKFTSSCDPLPPVTTPVPVVVIRPRAPVPGPVPAPVVPPVAAPVVPKVPLAPINPQNAPKMPAEPNALWSPPDSMYGSSVLRAVLQSIGN